MKKISLTLYSLGVFIFFFNTVSYIIGGIAYDTFFREYWNFIWGNGLIFFLTFILFIPIFLYMAGIMFLSEEKDSKLIFIYKITLKIHAIIYVSFFVFLYYALANLH